MIDIIIKDFPMPVSVNKSMMPVIGRLKFNKNGKPYGSGRFVKTEEYKKFEAEAIKWELSHKKGLEALKAEIIKRRQMLNKEGMELTLKVQYFAVFPKEKLITVTNKLERRDADNLIKTCKDVLFKGLCLDDKHVFKDEIEKVVGESEYMIIKITEYSPKTEQNIKSILGLR